MDSYFVIFAKASGAIILNKGEMKVAKLLKSNSREISSWIGLFFNLNFLMFSASFPLLAYLHPSVNIENPHPKVKLAPESSFFVPKVMVNLKPIIPVLVMND